MADGYSLNHGNTKLDIIYNDTASSPLLVQIQATPNTPENQTLVLEGMRNILSEDNASASGINAIIAGHDSNLSRLEPQYMPSRAYQIQFRADEATVLPSALQTQLNEYFQNILERVTQTLGSPSSKPPVDIKTLKRAGAAAQAFIEENGLDCDLSAMTGFFYNTAVTQHPERTSLEAANFLNEERIPLRDGIIGKLAEAANAYRDSEHSRGRERI